MHALLRRLSERHKPAILLVTHDIDEAIALADRIVMLDDGRLAADLRVRDAANAALRTTLLAKLGVG